MKDYEVVIGLEVHAQLLTTGKMFCSCGAGYQDTPTNTSTCPVCMGMPGVLPVINKRAVELVIKTGLALDCKIANHTKFDRKNYPYPDLMKGYQISQYDKPIAENGSLVVDVDGHERSIRIARVHLEEDVAKLFHKTDQQGHRYSLLDVNRSGVPLMEVVSEPDMRSPKEARNYLTRLRSIFQYINVSTSNMEEGSFRCDANISVRPEGSTDLGSKVEVKNMNSFRSIFSALEYETERQVRSIGQGKRIEQETRGWVEDRGITVSQRSKEYASDYRYFPEPDLPLISIDPLWVKNIRDSLPELPIAKISRFVKQYGLPIYDAELLTSSRAYADLFESVIAIKPFQGKHRKDFAKSVSNWFLGELTRLLNLTGTSIEDVKISPVHIVELLELISTGTLNTNMAKTVFEEMFNTGKSPQIIAEMENMFQISDTETILAVVKQSIDDNPQPVSDYLNGKETAIKFLIGQVMKTTKGRANPQRVSELIIDELKSQ